MTVVFEEEARADVSEVLAWYEARRPGLGGEFVGALDEAVGLIAAAPAVFPVVHRSVRRALVRRFPYAVYFTVDDGAEGAVTVVAVMHGRRHPDAWRRSG